MSGQLDWATKLLYISFFLGAILLSAIFLYLLCYLSSQDDSSNSENNQQASNRRRRSSDEPKQQQQRPADEVDTKNLLSLGKQTMVSSLFQSAKDTDVIVATAVSSIPLKELGGKDNDIVIDVSQRMQFNDEKINPLEHKCIVCQDRKVTWDQVSCFAQTTIGVLVYKRSLNSSTQGGHEEAAHITKESPTPNSSLFPPSNLKGLVAPKKQQPINRTESTLSLAPTPDSRILATPKVEVPPSAPRKSVQK